MNKMLAEFKEFIRKGDVVTIAVGLIMALYFAKIVDAVLNGVINPIIAAIFGESNYSTIGFDIGDARISIGLVIDAAISFVVSSGGSRTRPLQSVLSIAISPRSERRGSTASKYAS